MYCAGNKLIKRLRESLVGYSLSSYVFFTSLSTRPSLSLKGSKFEVVMLLAQPMR